MNSEDAGFLIWTGIIFSAGSLVGWHCGYQNAYLKSIQSPITFAKEAKYAHPREWDDKQNHVPNLMPYDP